MSLCLTSAGAVVALGLSAFTLSWSHSVEKIRWEEDWQLASSGLRLVEARVKGSGAGMEVPDGARLDDGWWRWTPDLPPQPALVLAASGATGSGWRICGDGHCREIGRASGAPIRIAPCERAPARRTP